MAGDGEKGKKGFAGLDSLLSEVGAANRPAEPVPPRKPRTVVSVPKSDQGAGKQVAKVEPTPPRGLGPAASLLKPDQGAMRLPKMAKVEPPASSQAAGWTVLIGIALVFLLVLVLAESKNAKPRSGVSARPVSSSAAEQKPPAGKSLMLNEDQIRYCLSEKIRLSAWSDGVDNYSQNSVRAFNASVADYNARCSHFRYRRASLDRVRAQVEANRHSLQQQGRTKALLNP